MRTLFALLTTTLSLAAAAGQAQLLPAGEFRARDGRPGPGKSWRLSDAQGTAVAAALTAVAKRTPVVIDYEHQTLYAPQNGQPAPAAGWITAATWRPGEGLYADVEWTAEARSAIESKKYLYISPVITYDDAGNVTGVALAALTNFPAILGMDAAIAALSAQFDHQEPDMQLTALLTALGLAAGTSEQDALAAVTALRAKPMLPPALVTELGLQAGADEAAALNAVKALKTAKDTSGAAGDQALLQLVTQLTTQVSALQAEVSSDKVASAVDKAIDDCRLAAALRDQYVALGRKDMAMLTAILDKMPVIPGLKGQSGGGEREGGGNGAALTATQAKIATQLGLDPKAYAESLKASA